MMAAKEEGTNTFILDMDSRLLVIDRLIKIEALEYKMGVGRAGAAFDDEEGDE